MAGRLENELRFAEDVIPTKRKIAVKVGLFFGMLAVGVILDASVDGRLSLGFVLRTLSLVVGSVIVFFTVAGVGLFVLSPLPKILARIVPRRAKADSNRQP